MFNEVGLSYIFGPREHFEGKIFSVSEKDILMSSYRPEIILKICGRLWGIRFLVVGQQGVKDLK